jgi:FkbM family methyltransferase
LDVFVLFSAMVHFSDFKAKLVHLFIIVLRFNLKSINVVVGTLGLLLIKSSRLTEFKVYERLYWSDPFLQVLKHPERVKLLVSESKSQLRQDLFVISECDFKVGGFYVEFGALDGIESSNTFLLEKKFLWSGILCEPSKFYHEQLKVNRSAQIDERCVWSSSDSEMDFIDLGNSGLSTLSVFKNKGMHSEERSSMIDLEYKVVTVSLNSLLDYHNAPRNIDYISIDTEGSEFEILQAFDFDAWNVRIFTVEHNYESFKRENIFKLMTNAGYIRVYQDISRADDWYLKQ